MLLNMFDWLRSGGTSTSSSCLQLYYKNNWCHKHFLWLWCNYTLSFSPWSSSDANSRSLLFVMISSVIFSFVYVYLYISYANCTHLLLKNKKQKTSVYQSLHFICFISDNMFIMATRIWLKYFPWLGTAIDLPLEKISDSLVCNQIFRPIFSLT